MTDEFSEYKCPICGETDNLDTTLGICLSCGYEASMDKALGYQITCNSTTHGNCTVVTDYGNITDGQTCTVPYGSVVIITAIPDTNYYFSAWAGGSATLLSGNPCRLFINQAITFSATMVILHTITIAAVTGGVPYIDGTAANNGSDSSGYNYVTDGDHTLLMVAADNTHIFTTWAGTGWSAANNATNPITITVGADVALAPTLQAMSGTVDIVGQVGNGTYHYYAKNATAIYIQQDTGTLTYAYAVDVTDKDWNDYQTPTTGLITLTVVSDTNEGSKVIIVFS